jgi:hypothetical protein
MSTTLLQIVPNSNLKIPTKPINTSFVGIYLYSQAKSLIPKRAKFFILSPIISRNLNVAFFLFQDFSNTTQNPFQYILKILSKQGFGILSTHSQPTLKSFSIFQKKDPINGISPFTRSLFPQYLYFFGANPFCLFGAERVGPGITYLFKLGSVNLYLKLFCLSFDTNVPIFYFNYINYFGLLIFCCQIVATSL